MARPERGCLLGGLLGLLLFGAGLRFLAALIFTVTGFRNEYVPSDADAIALVLISAAQFYFAREAWGWRRNGILGLYLMAAVGAVWNLITESQKPGGSVVWFLAPLAWAAFLWIAVRPVWQHFNGAVEYVEQDDDSEPEPREPKRKKKAAEPKPEPVAVASASEGWECACGTTNRSSARHCKGCGKRKPRAKRKCKHCGTVIEADSRFCDGCGAEQLPLDKPSKKVESVAKAPALATRACPNCGETIRADVARCRYCLKRLPS